MPDVPPALFYPYYTSNQSGAPPGPNEAPVSSTTNNNGGNGGAISQSSSGDYSAILAQAGGHPTWGAQNGDSYVLEERDAWAQQVQAAAAGGFTGMPVDQQQ